MPRLNWSWLLGSSPQRPAAELESQWAALQESHAVIEFDLHGKILTANPIFLATMGYTLSEIVGQHHSMFVDAATAASPHYQTFWERLRQGKYASGCYPRTSRDGSEVWLQASYNPILDRHKRPYKVVKFATNVTEQQRRSADAHGQLTAISKVQAMIEFDLQGHILSANDLFLNAMGYRLDEIVGKHHSMFVQAHERHAPAYAKFWSRLAQGTYDAGQYLRIGKHGQEVWIEASYNPILDAAGRPFKVVKFATNITRRFTAAQTLRVTVQELTHSAQHAEQANQLANNACRVAEAGGCTMQDVVATMEHISQSSRQISDIIGVVDSIAFQTNILALNAAVEAARAGEQGKGFAVVAGEVRSLAQNSASAAKAIKQLIQTSTQQVADGATQVRKAGQTMDEIVSASQQVTTIMAKVVQASLAQSAELQRVTDDLTAQDVSSAPPPPASRHPRQRIQPHTTAFTPPKAKKRIATA